MALEEDRNCSSEREGIKGGGVKNCITQVKKRVKGTHIHIFLKVDGVPRAAQFVKLELHEDDLETNVSGK